MRKRLATVTPAQAGAQKVGWRWMHWIPACAGTTIQEKHFSKIAFQTFRQVNDSLDERYFNASKGFGVRSSCAALRITIERPKPVRTNPASAFKTMIRPLGIILGGAKYASRQPWSFPQALRPSPCAAPPAPQSDRSRIPCRSTSGPAAAGWCGVARSAARADAADRRRAGARHRP